MGKVEAEFIRRHHRTSLLDVLTKNLAQSVLQQVSGCMIAGDVPAALRIHRGCNFLTYLQAAAFHLAKVHGIICDVDSIGDRQFAVVIGEAAGVPHLAAHLTVKWGDIKIIPASCPAEAESTERLFTRISTILDLYCRL